MATPLAPSDVINAIVGILQAADPAAKIIPHELLGVEDGESPDVYRSDLDNQRIHAWTIHRASAVIRRNGDVGYDLNHASRTRRADKTWTFQFKLYFQYATGQTSLGGSNSRTELDSLLDTVQEAFFKKPKLNLANENLRQHNDLQFSPIKVIQAGDVKLHMAVGRLDVIVWESIAP